MAADLKRRLYACTKESPLDQRKFIPKCDIEGLITRENISKLVKVDPGFPFEETSTVIAILVFSGQISQNKLECLAYAGFTNECLPVTHSFSDIEDGDATLESIPTGRTIHLSPAFDDIDCIAFRENQWRFIAPVLGGVKHSQYHENIALPIIEKGPESFGGSFGRVNQVKVHHAHLKLSDDLPGPTQERNPCLALKELLYDEPKSFLRERTALERIQKLRHKHLINFVGSFEKGQNDRRFYFLFPWASGGHLKGFWSDPTRVHEPRSPDMLRWVVSQIKGVASGITVLHGPATAQDENGRHGDLRPENILLFHDDPTYEPWGTLQITDAGLARFHQLITSKRLAGTSTQGGSIEYAPPEANDEDGKRGRRYDMWSLGCILLEFSIWVLGGFEDVHAFKVERAKLPGLLKSHRMYPPFYRTKPGNGGGQEESYEENPVVRARIRAIREDRRCPPGTFLRDLLDVIEKGLLRIEENERFYAADLDRRMGEIVNKCSRDSYFWAEGVDVNFFGPTGTSSVTADGNEAASPPQGKTSRPVGAASPTSDKQKKRGLRMLSFLSRRRRDN